MSIVGQKIETTCDDFGHLIRKNCLMVDKTLMIKEFLDEKIVSLIIRPRRFGKTINLSMLQYFFSPEVAGVKTAGLFDHLAIAQMDNGEFLRQHQGQYAVIFMTLKDLKEPSFASTVNQFRNLVQKLYREHAKLLLSNDITHENKVLFEQYLNGSVDDEKLQMAIAFLSEFLYNAHGKNKKVMILIDEYDSPLTQAYQKNFLEPLSDFMRDMLSSSLKTNPFLEKGLMTGILRVSKNNMLSGLNNLKVYSLLDKGYRQYFGFTEEEIKELVYYTKNDVNIEDLRAYYNGYIIGDKVMYNPWSTMQFLDSGKLDTYWVATSNDHVLRDIFLNSSLKVKEKLTALMKKEVISGNIQVNLCYEDLMNSPDALWTLLLFCGYLTIVSKEENDLDVVCQLRVPNREIQAQYRRIFNDWLKRKIGTEDYADFLQHLLRGEVEAFRQLLSDYLLHSFSFMDVGNSRATEDGIVYPIHPSEKFYHGFVMGLIANIQDTHWVDSNKESGLGRYDVMLTPKDARYSMGIVLEFKYTKKVKNLVMEAKKAIEQIDQQHYVTALKRLPHIKSVLKVGLSFCEKAVHIAHQEDRLDLNHI